MASADMDIFARPRKNDLSPSELSGEGKGEALVLRYAGCNLRCPLCYAWKYAWHPDGNSYKYGKDECISSLASLPGMASKKIMWVRG